MTGVEPAAKHFSVKHAKWRKVSHITHERLLVQQGILLYWEGDPPHPPHHIQSGTREELYKYLDQPVEE